MSLRFFQNYQEVFNSICSTHIPGAYWTSEFFKIIEAFLYKMETYQERQDTEDPLILKRLNLSV